MVTVSVNDACIKVTGHADTAPHGQDIVCASVSVLMQALEVGINPNFLEVVKKEPGDLEYKLYEPTNTAVQLVVMSCVKMVIDTIKVLADQYPDDVEVVIG